MRHEAARAGEAVAGLRVVLTLLKHVKAASGVLALCAVQAPGKEVLDITGFTGMLDVLRDERRPWPHRPESAVAAICQIAGRRPSGR